MKRIKAYAGGDHIRAIREIRGDGSSFFQRRVEDPPYLR